jgi:hypothetical protein
MVGMDNYIRVHIGAKKKCMIIDVYLDNDAPNLTAVSYNANCNIQGTMERGYGTVSMIKAGIKFIQEYFKDDVRVSTKELFIKDTSIIPCKRSFELPLSVLYMAKHNKTWYEKHLDAKPSHNLDAYSHGKKALKDFLSTKPSPDQIFISNTPQNIKETLKQKYIQVRSIKDFICGLNNSDCYVYKGYNCCRFY